MYGSSEEFRRGTGNGLPANIAWFAPADTQPPASLSDMLRRIWLRFSAKS
jgi:hypothetical protein